VVDASRSTARRGDALRYPPLGRGWGSANALIAALGLCVACGNSDADPEPTYRSRAELLDPQTCGECHATHYSEWSGSMHAYSAKDPVFVAMNRRGQEATNGELGKFCVNCHAPMAVREAERAGLTDVDWANFQDLPHAADGVSCYFCHNTSAVEGRHNAALRLTDDVTMRARITDPAQNPAHASEYSPLLSGAQPESADACGACHDIVLPSPPAPPPMGDPVELERTFREWQSSVFSPQNALTPSSMATCAGCHMPRVGPDQVIAEGPGLNVRPRARHTHAFPGVDLAFPSVPATPDPAQSASLRATQQQLIQDLLDTTLLIEICVEKAPLDFSAVYVTLDNANAGHNWPSGASQDRRAWVEVTAYRNGQVLYTNAVPGDLEPPADSKEAWIFRDRIFDGDREVHMFWEANRVERGTIGVQLKRSDPNSFNAAHAARRFPASGVEYIKKLPGDDSSIPDRVTVRIRLRAMGSDVLGDLVGSGHLDAALPAEIQTFDLLPKRKKPPLPSFASVSMEWSEEVKNSGAFKVQLDTSGGKVKDCISMLR